MPAGQETDEIEPVNGFDCVCVSHTWHTSVIIYTYHARALHPWSHTLLSFHSHWRHS